MRRRRGGYTLIELVMVILILGIMLSLVFSRLDYLSPRHALRAEARRIAKTVALARSQAVTQGRIYFVRYDLEERRYFLLVPSEPETPAPTEPSATVAPIPELRWQPLFRHDLSEGIFFRDITIGSGEAVGRDEVTVEISPFGFTKGHIVHLTDGQSDYSIEFNALTGEARFHEEYVDPPPVEQDSAK